jgi:hypothetical protein
MLTYSENQLSSISYVLCNDLQRITLVREKESHSDERTLIRTYRTPAEDIVVRTQYVMLCICFYGSGMIDHYGEIQLSNTQAESNLTVTMIQTPSMMLTRIGVCAS